MSRYYTKPSHSHHSFFILAILTLYHFDEINHKRIPSYTGELLCRKIAGQYLSPTTFKLTASPRLVVKNPRSFWCISVFISSQLINSWLIRYVSFWIDSFQESPETLNVDFDAAVFMREINTGSDICDSMVYFPSYWLCNIAGILWGNVFLENKTRIKKTLR